MTESIINYVRELIGNDYITTVLIAMIPIVELRGAIPAAMTMGIHPLLALALAWAGSAIVSPILLLILQPVLKWMKKYKAFASLANAVESGFRSKALKVVGASDESKLTPELMRKLERKKMLGVYIFVAVPFPMTGVWTGSAVSTFLDIPFFKSMMMVWLGNLTAGLIVTALAVVLADYMNIVLDIFFIIVLLVLALYILRVVIKMVKSKKQAQADAAKGEGVVADKDENAQGAGEANISDSDKQIDADKEQETALSEEEKDKISDIDEGEQEAVVAPTSTNKKKGAKKTEKARQTDLTSDNDENGDGK